MKKFIKEGRVVYYHEEVQVEIIFEITCEVSKDESIASTYIEIKKVRNLTDKSTEYQRQLNIRL